MTMKPPIEDTRRHLGELGAMADQTQRVEQQILERAERQLAALESKLPDLRSGALAAAPDASQQYQDLIFERGRLHQVIAQARQHLS